MLEELHHQGKINDYFYSKLKNSIIFHVIEPEDLDSFINDIIEMSTFGVQSKEDELLARSILLHVHDIIADIKSNAVDLGPEILHKLYLELFNNKELLSTTNIFCTVADAAKKVGIKLKESTNEECQPVKVAYPHGNPDNNLRPQYDINRWMQATRDIYARLELDGLPYEEVFNICTANFDTTEKFNYRNWLKFYLERTPLKYPKLANRKQVKTAQFLNGFLPDLQLPQPEVEKPHKPDMHEVRDRIEGQRSRILSRLTSAERLLASLDGQGFAGDDQELMLKLLQDLKRKVQTANKITIQSTLFEDFIWRAGNCMQDVHKSKIGAKFFFKLAQMDPMAMMPEDQGVPDVSDDQSKEETKQAFRELKEMLEDGVYDSNDDPDEIKKEKDSVNEAPATPALPAAPNPVTNPGMPPIPVQASFDADIVVFAQVQPNAQPQAPNDMQAFMPPDDISITEAEVAPPQDKPGQNRPRLEPDAVDNPDDIVVTEEEVQEAEEIANQPSDDSDDVIEDALSNITIHDAISRLEVLVGIYKKREVPRQLSILDIMMNTLGLSSYFPGLGEAMAKSLESSQYISTRLEDVLNKLKGSVESKDADEWISHVPEPKPETVAVQNKLQHDQDEEDRRKELRKEKSNSKLEGTGQTPVGEKSEELAQPTRVQTAPPVPVR